MNTDLSELIVTYGTKNHSDVLNLLNDKSKSNIVSMLLDLLTQYFNDKNSSTLREFLVVSLSGFTPLTEKIGYNGYRHSSAIQGNEYCEAKPKNITTDKPNKKLDGGGNFTDYSWQKFNRHKTENPTMLLAGFINGRLIYIFHFKFLCPDFINRIKTQLQNNFPNGDETGKYLRSASFTLNAYKNTPDLKVKTFVEKQDIEQYYQDKRLTKGIYDLLLQNI